MFSRKYYFSSSVCSRIQSPPAWQLIIRCASTTSPNLNKTDMRGNGANSNTFWLKLNLPPYEEKDAWTRARKTFRGKSTCAVLLLPITTFALGCWQWERHKWKTELIGKLKIATKTAPVEFPVDNLSALDDMEFRKVHVRGVYIFDRQFVIRWRCRLDPSYDGTSNSEKYGAYVITPMRLDGTNLTIMVNRGWIPHEKIESELKKGKQTRESELKELNAVVRKAEKVKIYVLKKNFFSHLFLFEVQGSPFVKNNPEKGIWAFRDVDEMARQCDAAPIIVDADFESTETGGPIGGQTNVVLRNQHYSYMLQWFGLTLALLGMWSLRFL